MRLLVLGGTRFVGRAVVTDALARGWDVTALHRGRTGQLPAGVHVLHADRTDPDALTAALGVQHWDASPLVEGNPAGTAEDDYSAAGRGAELGVLAAFPDALLVRAGLILSPHEDIGRLPWWLQRIAAGGRVVAPGDPDRPLQYDDARDLATFTLDALQAGTSGPFDVISPSGHTSTAGLLDACVGATGADTDLVWTSEADLATAGVEPWTHLPCWVPQHGESTGFLEVDTARTAAGLVCRPEQDTVDDMRVWMQQGDLPPQRPDRAVHGLPLLLEEELLGRTR
ncbi:MAG: NAD-dependent epimerase/dehydratase family protein [Janthinobacterium lividum]